MSENDNKDLRAKIRSLFESESFVKGVFITSITGISALVSFSFALSSARKRNPVAPDDVSAQVYNSGAKLALRALKWGTFYAVTGCGLLIFGVWKAANVNNMEEFRQKMGKLFPAVPKNNPPQSRTEFSSLTDLMRYLDDEFSTKKPVSTEAEETDS